MSALYCINCQTAIPSHVDRCVGCGHDVGFPNDRAAAAFTEVDALNSNYQQARARCATIGASAVADLLETELRASTAVICKPWGVINTLLDRDSRLLQTFHQEVESEGRTPEANDFDRERAGIDATFFPHYHQRMRFAALSIDGQGPVAYGGGCLVLKELSIAERSTVFIENTITYVRRTRLPAGSPPPPGLTATWANRVKLGIAKLADRLRTGMQKEDLAAIVLTQTGKTDGDDFLEVHVYGPIHRSAVALLAGEMPRNDADHAMVVQMKSDLARIGVQVEVKE